MKELFFFFSSDDSADEAELLKPGYKDAEGNKILNGITISKTGKCPLAVYRLASPPSSSFAVIAFSVFCFDSNEKCEFM